MLTSVLVKNQIPQRVDLLYLQLIAIPRLLEPGELLRHEPLSLLVRPHARLPPGVQLHAAPPRVGPRVARARGAEHDVVQNRRHAVRVLRAGRGVVDAILGEGDVEVVRGAGDDEVGRVPGPADGEEEERPRGVEGGAEVPH